MEQRNKISAEEQATLLEHFQRDADKSENAERLAKCCDFAYGWGYEAAQLDAVYALKKLWEVDEL